LRTLLPATLEHRQRFKGGYVNTTDPIIHTAACIRAMARQEAYDLSWPARCGDCFGAGGWSSFDPSPTGSSAPASLGHGSMQDFDTCTCVDTGNCPRCGNLLLGPKWRPLNGLSRDICKNRQ
jgi:hypothetical protein